MHKIALHPLNDAVAVQTGSLLLPALLAKKLNVAMSCGGNGICSTCHVRVREGMDQLSPMGAKERRTLALVADADYTSRLACQTSIQGDGVVLELPKGMYIEKVDDLLELLGARAPDNILHPIRGTVLIPKGKIITRTLLEQSRSLDDEVRQMKEGLKGSGTGSLVQPPAAKPFTVTGRGLPPPNGAVKPTPTAGKPPSPPTPSPPPVPDPHRSTTASLSGSTAWQSATRTSAPKSESSMVPLPRTPGSGTFVNTELRKTDVIAVSLAARKSLSDASKQVLAGPPPTANTGSRVGKCLLTECIGKGGAGRVFRALHTTLNITVAVKFLNESTGVDAEGMLARFRGEARMLAQLNHPNVVRVLDFEDDVAMPYVVMEFVDGLSLVDLIRQSGRVRPDRAIAIVLQAAAGLEAAAKLAIIHRDVKPANILISREGTVKLVDLGLARQVDPNQTQPVAGKRVDDAIEGTLAYLAPEQAMNPTAADHRADIYSLGVTFFQMLTGQLPFAARSRGEALMKLLHQPPPSVLQFEPDLDPVLADVILRMMQKLPEERFQTYADLRVELQAMRRQPAKV